MTAMPTMVKPGGSGMAGGDLLRSGGSVAPSASVRAGYLPLALEHLLFEGVANIPLYLRTAPRQGHENESHFTLYCNEETRFTAQHRIRLREAGVRFIYIQMKHQMQFRRQIERQLEQAVGDPGVAISTKAELVYDTSVELMNEVLAEQGLGQKMPRLETVARAVTTLVINDGTAFSHLFAASQHDFYTATHLVNVGTWMVSLAYAMGIRGMEELNLVCLAGMLHDLGKLFVSEEVLNRKGKLSAEDWTQLRAHPALGGEHLAKYKHIPEEVLRVAREHHERIDGSGYPRGLRGEEALLLSRICAVVDSFDAMTAFRPFKERTLSFGRALQILREETPSKYDGAVMEAWVGLMREADSQGSVVPPLDESDEKVAFGRRAHERFTIECPARMHPVYPSGNGWAEQQGMQVTAHSISRGGLGFLSRDLVQPTQYVRVYLMGQGSLANRVVEGQVVRCREYNDGWHEVGIRLVSLAEEVAAAEAGAATEEGTSGNKLAEGLLQDLREERWSSSSAPRS